MRRRCYSTTNNRFEFYGKIGITVCDEWNPLKGGSFEKFLEDLGSCPEGYSLERVDLKGNYCKDNCKWASDIEQANNKSNNILISKGGEVWSLRRWCEVLGLDYKSCWYYLCKVKLPVSTVLKSEGFTVVKGNKWIDADTI